MAQQRELAGNTVLFYYSIFRILNCILKRQRVRSCNPQIHPKAGNPFPAGEGFPFSPVSLSSPYRISCIISSSVYMTSFKLQDIKKKIAYHSRALHPGEGP